MKNIVILVMLVFLFSGCVHIPTQQECTSVLNRVAKKKDINQSRVYIFVPEKGFFKSLHFLSLGTPVMLLGSNLELTYILYDDINNSTGYVGKSTLAFIDTAEGSHNLYAQSGDIMVKDDENIILSSKIDFEVKKGEDLYFIIKDGNTIGTAITGSGYTKYYEQIDLKTLSDLIKLQCKDNFSMKIKNLTKK